MMKHTRRPTLPAGLAAVLAPVVVTAAPAAAEPSCVAQSIAAEHAVYGSAWGHDLLAFLATHREVLQEFGFRHLGALASVRRGPGPEQLPARSLEAHHPGVRASPQVLLRGNL